METTIHGMNLMDLHIFKDGIFFLDKKIQERIQSREFVRPSQRIRVRGMLKRKSAANVLEKNQVLQEANPNL